VAGRVLTINPDPHGPSRLVFPADKPPPPRQEAPSAQPPPPPPQAAPKPSAPLSDADIDAYVLRLILNSALLDEPPSLPPADPAKEAPAGFTPGVARSYWDLAQALDQLTLKTGLGTGGRLPSYASHPAPPVGRPLIPGPPPAASAPVHAHAQQDAGKEPAFMSDYEATALYERARVMERAAAAAESRQARGEGRRGTRSALDFRSEDVRLFEEHYARFLARLSFVSREEVAAEADMLSAEPQGFAMASALAEAVREVFTDAVILRLIKESVLVRVDKKRREQAEAMHAAVRG
jgi:hypothetical protein